MQIELVGDILARTLRPRATPQPITNPAEIARLRELGTRYDNAFRARPFVNRIQLGLTLGLAVFKLEMAELLDRTREPERDRTRQLLMAFIYVAGNRTLHGYDTRRHDRICYQAIGRAFARTHATVIHAVKKYEDGVREHLR